MKRKRIRKRYVIDNTGEKYPFSRGVLARSLTKTGLSIDEAYKVADEVASKFKGTITSEELTKLVLKILKPKYGKRSAEKYRQLISEKEILVAESDGKTFVPFSRGILAGSIRSAGVDVQSAFEISKEIADYLRQKGKFKVTRGELRKIASTFLKEKLGKGYAQRYLLWRQLKTVDKPIIILIGGATGVGKSRLAAELAEILEINRMASTDSIREVMRRMLSKELVPSIHVSSYEAGKVIYKFGEMGKEEKILYGFLDQTERVLTGVEAVINRAIKENVSLIIEGIHLIPGALDKFKSRSYIVQLILTTLDEEIHKSRFKSREKTSQRTSKKYLRNFKSIRLIQDYLYRTATERDIPVVENIGFDQTRERAIEMITNRLVKRVGVSV